jgi:hypothetical protein
MGGSGSREQDLGGPLCISKWSSKKKKKKKRRQSHAKERCNY